MSENFDLILEKLFEVNFNRDTEEIINDLQDKITADKGFDLEEIIDDDKKEIILNFNPKDEKSKITNLLVAAGLPNEQFDKAESMYRDKFNNNGAEYKYNLHGTLQGGAYAQYAGLMASGSKINQQVVTYNSIGIEPLLQFNGNEFLGYKAGLLYYLNDIFQVNSYMGMILYQLTNEGVIKKGNISSEYRDEFFESIKVEKMKATLIKVLNKVLELDEEEIEEQVEESFNPYIIERKMRLIDKYQKYKARRADEPDNIINYIISDNITARIFKQIGATYLVDQNLKRFDGGLDEELINRIERLEENQLDKLLESRVDLFEPYMLLTKGANGQSAKNRFGDTPKIGNITNNLSLDYLRSLVKDIILDLSKKDSNLLIEMFKLSRQGTGKRFINIIKDRLRHSMNLQQKLDDEVSFESRYLEENPDLFDDNDKVYRLDQAALEQLERMRYPEIRELWQWELTGEGVFLKLGKELAEDEEVKEYHSSYSAEKFDNQEERIQLDLNQPSLNRIYGSLKQNSRYKEEYDVEYINEEKDGYEFPATQGVGVEIINKYVRVERSIKVDGQDISGSYNEADEMEGKKKIGGQKFYGDNILYKKDRSELIYYYGPNQEDKLIIDGFKNGDYGINLVDKVKEANDTEVPLTYTPHQVKFDAFEFKVLDKLEIEKSIYQHSYATIKGTIAEEKLEDYEIYLGEEDPKLVLTYDNDENKILFKGIIENYKIGYHGQNCYLELKAVSYSRLLERKKINRIYQNLNTTHNQVFEQIMADNPEFKIAFADESIGESPLVSEDYPIVLQYKETEWDFIKRIASYQNQILVVDDTKDDSETINILAGPHEAEPKELNNLSGAKSKQTTGRDNIFHYYKVYRYRDYSSKEIYDIGKSVKYKLNNQEDTKIELIIIKNKIYMSDGILYSDLTLVEEDQINILKEKRKREIAGHSFRAEIKQLDNKHRAQVEFLDVFNEYDEATSYYFPLDKVYTNSYFAPEVGDIIDVYFKSKNERHATIKSSSTDNNQEVENDPADKVIFSSTGNAIKLNNEVISLASKEKKSSLDVKEELINVASNTSQLALSSTYINVKTEKANGLIDDSKTEFSFGSKVVVISDDGISVV
ncbi:hypothetical protein U472_13235 [Orenia metallireducens]|uniref:Uncharacterized protein n=1 Tax=Orenia metallireducens TaxID=1413210 RepID=A0A1C0A5A2_9FIRM|nr:hypothetical protein [Orenia metallireducens]OCL25315.1 hypothetical protein U472_13235 [Orenia metallireducens]